MKSFKQSLIEGDARLDRLSTSVEKANRRVEAATRDISIVNRRIQLNPSIPTQQAFDVVRKASETYNRQQNLLGPLQRALGKVQRREEKISHLPTQVLGAKRSLGLFRSLAKHTGRLAAAKAVGDPKREAFSSKMIEKIKKQMGIA